MKVPFSKEVTAKSAPIAAHQPKINQAGASIKVNFDKVKKPAKVAEKVYASKEAFAAAKAEVRSVSKKRDESNRSSIVSYPKTGAMEGLIGQVTNSQDSANIHSTSMID